MLASEIRIMVVELLAIQSILIEVVTLKAIRWVFLLFQLTKMVSQQISVGTSS
jgi:hypothetical protein